MLELEDILCPRNCDLPKRFRERLETGHLKHENKILP